MKEPEISVGIVNAQEIHFSLNGNYFAKGETVCGDQVVTFNEGGILWNGNLYRELTFTPQEESNSFSLYDVTIGINFHWERQETQIFMGTLRFVVHEDKITAINQLSVEDYLTSVISSEMSASASEEFLKAHAVISRSWVMAQIASSHKEHHVDVPDGIYGVPALMSHLDSMLCIDESRPQSKIHEYVRWYDHDDHKLFDVCADDHCQRYQGLTRATGETVRRVIDATWGQTLCYGDELCDARFSKCCGGVMETFDTC